jgi:hypothetical protein
LVDRIMNKLRADGWDERDLRTMEGISSEDREIRLKSARDLQGAYFRLHESAERTATSLKDEA